MAHVHDNTKQTETIIGTVERFLFQSADNHFAIFILQAATHSKEPITVKATIAHICLGQEVHLKGVWIYHPKFGKQFEAQSCTTVMPTTLVGLKKYLGSGLIKGIGRTYADKIVNYFGVDVLTIIDKHPERLNEVTGIGPKKIEKIVEAWRDQKDVADIMVFLQDKGISPAYAAKIYKHYQQESIAVLHENPYRLADEIWGIGFKLADEIAQKLGFQPQALQRIAAGILYVISSTTSQGHLYVELEDLKAKTATLLGLDALEHEQLVKQALHLLHDKTKIKHISHEEKHYVTLSAYFYCEKGIAQKIKQILQRPSHFTHTLDNAYALLRMPNPGELQLNEDQQRGIMSCLQNKITIITGGPGTGKTTIIKTLLSLLDASHLNYKLAAPTGRAAKRIIEGTGKYATTLHRLLEFNVSTMSFNYNESNALKLDFLIIDEASMLDAFLTHSLLKAFPYQAHIVFIGDIDQLPSVGAGNILHDLIASSFIACVRLTQIFRQAQNSLIIVNAHKINNGEFPITHLPDARRDFIFIKEEDPETITAHLKRILFVELAKKGISYNDTMILTPMNRGPIGTHALNHALQEILNPDHTYEKVSMTGTLYKKGDKVMQIRNNYDKQVYNGDIGIIEAVDLDEKSLIVNYDDKRRVLYEFDELNELVLAYAISIHKSQGSEYAAIIVPLFMQHFMLLQRNLIYTALTRARLLCIFIGQPKALAIAIKNAKSTQRLTFLPKFLSEDINT